MDSGEHHRASLPPLKLFDFDKNRRDEHEYQSRNTNMTPLSGATSSAPSPSYQYPSGPPPPYSHPAAPVQPSQMAHAGLSGARTPPEMRRMSGEDAAKDAAKQSLPSIHEALGVEQPRTYPSQQSSYSSAPPSQSQPQSAYPAPAPPSPPTARRSFAMEPPPPRLSEPSAFSNSRRSPGPQYRSEISPRTQQEPFERSRQSYSGAPPPPMLPQRNGGYSPVHHPAPYPHSYAPAEPSPSADRAPPPPHSTSASMPPPPPPSFAYGYANYPPRPSAYAASSAPYTAPTTSSVYQPSVTQPAPVHAEQPLDPARNVYGDSVKRHLDMYDFEAALNEIAQGSTYMLDFSRELGARMHQTQRTGPLPGTLPSIHEIDDLMVKSRSTLDSLGRMREVIAAQQAAYFQQAQEQQFKAQDEVKRDSVHQVDDSKSGGFAGPEAKKRRGRAAPPGRCHSCQRAETPEWRRGPDGARTLCNACGLHYAKLTRKQGAQKTSIGSSNLRPKSDPVDSKN